MKKLTAISILLVLLSTAAFAQLKVGFSANAWTDAVFFEKAQGDMADADTVKGAFNLFASSQSTAGSSGFDITFSYGGAGDGYSYDAMAKLDGGSLISRGAGVNSGPSLFQLIANAFGDYHVKGTAWVFEGYFGTEGNGLSNAVDNLAAFSDFVGYKLEGYGAIKFPDIADNKFIGLQSGTTIASGQDFKDMAGTGTTGTDDLKFGGTYAALGLNLGVLSIPIKIQVGSNFADEGYKNVMPLDSKTIDPDIPATSAEAVSAVFRVSGTKIADFISFDVVYRINGADKSTRLQFNNYVDDPLDTRQNANVQSNFMKCLS